MSKKERAAAALVVALIVGAIAQGIARQQAAVLGLSSLELVMLGMCAGAVTKRRLGA